MRNVLLGLLCIGLLAGCGDLAKDEDGKGAGGSGPGGGSAAICSRDNPCPTGQWCFNGVCAPGCTSDENCDANKYCAPALYCVAREIQTCPGTPCGDGFTCVNSYCVVERAEPIACQWKANMQDGCANNELCLQEDETQGGECLQFPACPKDDPCPVGTLGAVCNEGLIPTKDRICMTGLCTDQSHCPADFVCTKQGGSVGFCQIADGSIGSACTEDANCQDGLSCLSPGPTLPKTCMPGTSGGGTEGSTCTNDSDCADPLTCESFAPGAPMLCTE